MPHNDSSPNSSRILIGADTFFPDINGAARFTQDHAVRLARRGHEVHVIAPASRMRSPPVWRSTADSRSSCTGCGACGGHSTNGSE